MWKGEIKNELFSCCISSHLTQSCHVKLIELFSEKLYLIGLAALVVAVIMVSLKNKKQWRLLQESDKANESHVWTLCPRQGGRVNFTSWLVNCQHGAVQAWGTTADKVAAVAMNWPGLSVPSPVCGGNQPIRARFQCERYKTLKTLQLFPLARRGRCNPENTN